MIVDDRHFAYLSLQKGSLDRLKGDRAAWQRAYETSLAEDLAGMRPFLPATCRNVLDIGSGLGGIDALLNRHYGGGLDVRLLDGVDDPPVMTLHRKSFNSMAVARDFLDRNGVSGFGFYSPAEARAATPVVGIEFDLIISLGSWCFHYAPSEYLEFVYRCCTPRTVLLLDVRADKPEWRAQLHTRFFEVACAKASRKFNRLVLRAA